MELGRLWKLSMPKIRVYQRKTGAWRVKKLNVLSRKTLRQEISTGRIAHVNDKGRNTVIRDVITIDTVVTELS